MAGVMLRIRSWWTGPRGKLPPSIVAVRDCDRCGGIDTVAVRPSGGYSCYLCGRTVTVTRLGGDQEPAS